MPWPIPGVTHAAGGSGGARAHGEGRAGFHPNLQRIMRLLERLRAAGKRLRLAVSSALGSEWSPPQRVPTRAKQQPSHPPPELLSSVGSFPMLSPAGSSWWELSLWVKFAEGFGSFPSGCKRWQALGAEITCTKLAFG